MEVHVKDDRLEFLLKLSNAVALLEKLPKNKRTTYQAAMLAVEVDLAPPGIHVGDDIAHAVEFFGHVDQYKGGRGALILMSRLWEDRAYVSYMDHFEQKAA